MSDAIKKKPVTTTTNPYAAAQPGIQTVLDAAGKQYARKDKANAPIDPRTQSAFDQTLALAGQPVPGLADAQKYNTDLIANGGWTDDLRRAQGYLDPIASSADGLSDDQRGTASGIKDSMAQTQSYLNPFASGQYTEDPRLLASIAERERRAMNGAATQFGGGRYGSASIGQGMGSAMATAGNDLMLQSNENARNRQLQATGMLSDSMLQGSGLLSQMYDSGMNRKLQASGLLGNMAGDARSAAQNSTSMLPALDNLRYSGAERMAGVGDYYQQRTDAAKNWQNTKLNNYADIVAKMAGMGSTTTKPGTQSSAQSAIGGAAAGAGIGDKLLPGGWGAAIGGLGGGAAGWFS